MGLDTVIIAALRISPILKLLLGKRRKCHVDLKCDVVNFEVIQYEAVENGYPISCFVQLLTIWINHHTSYKQQLSGCTLQLRMTTWYGVERTIRTLSLDMKNISGRATKEGTIELLPSAPPVTVRIRSENAGQCLVIPKGPKELTLVVVFEMIGPVKRIERRIASFKIGY